MPYQAVTMNLRKEATRLKNQLKSEITTVETNIPEVQPPPDPTLLPGYVADEKKKTVSAIGSIKSRLGNLKDSLIRFETFARNADNVEETMQELIDYQADPIGNESVDDVLDEAEDHIVVLEARLVSLEALLLPAPGQPVQVAPAALAVAGAVTNQAPRVKYPPLKLPTFSGEPSQFESFWSTYEEQIHLDNSFTDGQKFLHLKALLDGKALQFLEHISAVGENYELAVKQLRDKYGNRRLVESSFLRKLKEIPKARHDAEQCRSTLDILKTTLAQMKKLNNDSGIAMIDIVENKFPQEIRLKLTEESAKAEADPNRTWHMDDVLNALELIVSQLEIWESKELNPRQRFEDTTVFAAMNTENVCIFCGFSHPSEECLLVSSQELRHQIFNDRRLCFKCGKAQHFAASCYSSCAKCMGNHFVALCPEICRKVEEQKRQFQRNFGQNSLPKRSFNPNFNKNSRQNHYAQNRPRWPKQPNRQQTNAVTEEEGGEQDQVYVATEAQKRGRKHIRPRVILPCGAAQLAFGNEVLKLFFDSGSQLSFILEDVAKSLNLKIIRSDVIHLRAFGANAAVATRVKIVELPLKQTDGRIIKFKVCTIKDMTAELLPIPLTYKDKKFIQDHKIAFSDPQSLVESVKPSILLGADYFWGLLTYKQQPKLPSGLHVVSTIFGNILSGPTKSFGRHAGIFQVTVMPILDIDNYFKLDTVGIREENETALTLETYKESIVAQDGEYQLALPFKSANQRPAVNLELAFKRLAYAFKKFANTPDTWAIFQSTFEDQLTKGIIEEVASENPADNFRPQMTYLPWRVVVTPGKSTTHRIVYDGSSHSRGTPSLNDCLDQGPCSLPSLVGCLLRFRAHAEVFTADVEKAFLQLRLEEESRDYTRFLWLKNPSKPPSSDNLKVFRFRRVLFGLNCSPFMLSACIDKHLDSFGQNVHDEFVHNTYVDNLLLGADSTTKLVEKYHLAKEIFSGLKMNLRQFRSNSPLIEAAFDETDKIDAEVIKVLGLQWNATKDRLYFKCVLPEQPKWTKRSVLQATAAIFDPLGVFLPLLIKAKIFHQKMWKDNLGWDEPLNEELAKAWNELRSSSSGLTFSLDRRYSLKSAKVSLCVFSDASNAAYAAVIYLRDSESGKTSFLYAKSRLSPLKGQTIPRLELLGVLIGLQMAQFLVKELSSVLEIDRIHLFCDSKIVLHWLNGTGKWTVFVENRLRTIRKIINDINRPVQIHYVATDENPADCATRGLSANEFAEHVWTVGPRWLMNEPESWPNSEFKFNASIEEDPEAIVEAEATSHIAQISEIWKATSTDFKKTRSRVAVYLRFLSFVFRKNLERLQGFIPELKHLDQRGGLNGRDWQAAETLIWKNHQRQWLSENFFKGCSNLNAFVSHDGLWRCKGRLGNARLPDHTKFPILVNREDPLVKNYALVVHQDLKHAGIDSTLTELRQTLWIPRGRALLRQLLHHCVICRRSNALPFRYPEAPHLPEVRVSKSKPFMHVGTDFLGPLMVKTQDGKQAKAYVLLVTCLATRLIHLEVVTSLNTDAFLRAFRRFCARRGLPNTVLSDNASTFKLASQCFNSLSASIGMQKIHWQFITPLAPWTGGVYERLVGSVKAGMTKALGRRVPLAEDFATLVAEIEGIVNSRPLTHVTDDSSSHVLRPIDFVQPEVTITFPSLETEEPSYGILSSAEDAISRWKQTSQTLDNFWKQWQLEYIPGFREGHRKHRLGRSGTRTEPIPGEVVLVTDENSPRSSWPLATVVEVHYSPDGVVRSATIRLKSHRLVRRAICQLVPLEILPQDQTPLPDKRAESVKPDAPPTTSAPSPRRSSRLRKVVNYKEASDSENEEDQVLCITTTKPAAWFSSSTLFKLLRALPFLNLNTKSLV